MVRSAYTLTLEKNECLLSGGVAEVAEQETGTSTAQTYASSINIMSTSINAAPELVIEEDERDEDGDDDDDDVDADLNLYRVCEQTQQSFAFTTEMLSRREEKGEERLEHMGRGTYRDKLINRVIHYALRYSGGAT